MKNLKVPDSIYSTMTSGLGTIEAEIPISTVDGATDGDFDDQRLGEILQRLADDAELHKLLSDEKMRCEIHRSNYEKIKAEYLRLMHSSKELMAEMENLRTEKVSQEESSKLTKKKFQDELVQLKAQMESLQSQIPTEAEKIIMDRELRNKHESLWKGRVDNILEDLEGAKLSIHNLMQENMALKVKIQQNSEESHRISDEISAKFEATIDHLKGENESLMTNQRPQIEALEAQNRTFSKENSKLRHQVQVFQEQLIEVQDKNSAQLVSISKLEHELTQTGKSSSITSRKLETENSNLRDHVAKLEKQFLEEKFRNNELNSDLKSLNNELTTAKQILETHNLESGAKLRRQKVEASNDSSRLECEIDRLRHQLRESQEDSTRLQSQMEIIKMEEERQKLENDQKLQTATKDLSFTIAELEARQAELIEKLRSTQKQLGTERIVRQQKDRETECNVAIIHKKEQEVEVLKALLAKLQKYGKNVDHDRDHDHPDFSDQISHSSGDQKRKGHNKANTKREDTTVASGAILENYKALKTKYDNLVESHKKFATILENIPQYSNIISST